MNKRKINNENSCQGVKTDYQQPARKLMKKEKIHGFRPEMGSGKSVNIRGEYFN